MTCFFHVIYRQTSQIFQYHFSLSSFYVFFWYFLSICKSLTLRGCKTGKQTAYLLSSSIFFRKEGWTPIIICEDFHFPCDLQGKCKDQPCFQFLPPSLNFYSRNALTFSDILEVRFTVLRAQPEGLRSAKSCPIALLPCDDDDGNILCKHHSRHSFRNKPHIFKVDYWYRYTPTKPNKMCISKFLINSRRTIVIIT